MLTEYDIQRLSTAIVDNLVNNDKFMQRIAKQMPRRQKMVSSSVAASILGITRKSVCEIAQNLGGIRGEGRSAHWMFPEEGLIERYLTYKQVKV